MEKRERALDWLVGLLPVVLMAVIGYRWGVPARLLIAMAGYLALTVLRYKALPTGFFPHALLTAVLVLLILPAAVPVWVAALGGILMAAAEGIPARIGRVTLPYWHPLAVTYVLLRLVFPTAMTAGFVLPAQWVGMDGISSATPLLALQGGETLHDTWQLFFGVRAGAMGELCVAAVLLGAGYLLLRRRLRLIAPACMLATVSLFSWIGWHSPLYGLLAGAPVLTAVLLADKEAMPPTLADQITAGVTAGAVTVLLRGIGGWADGTAVGLLMAYVAVFCRPIVWRWIRRMPGMLHAGDFFVKKKNNG